MTIPESTAWTKMRITPSTTRLDLHVVVLADSFGLAPCPRRNPLIFGLGSGYDADLTTVTLNARWVNDRNTPLARPLASKLILGVTTDVARILRVPTSWNRKDPE
mgnify:CR=1 FL=1